MSEYTHSGGGLMANAGKDAELPKWSVREVLAFTAGVHTSHAYEFSERTLRNVLTIRSKTPFDVSSFGDPDLQRQMRHIFEDAALLFYSLQENHRNTGTLSDLILPRSFGEADFFFAEALYQEIHLDEKTDFAQNNRWQEVMINGLWNKDELIEGIASEKTLKNHALVQSVLWVGRELIEKVKNDDDWNGPSAADFDKTTFVTDFRKERSGAIRIGDENTYMTGIELRLYWAIRGIAFYESKRVPMYDKTNGQLISDAPAEVLLAQCFKRIFDSYSEVLEPVESFPRATFSDGSLDISPDTLQGTSVKRWIEFRAIDPTPSISDKEAVNFLYSNLPAPTGSQPNLVTLFNSIQGAGTVIDAAAFWASKLDRSGHPDHANYQPGTPNRVALTYTAGRNKLDELRRNHSWMVNKGNAVRRDIRIGRATLILGLASVYVFPAVADASAGIFASASSQIIGSESAAAEILNEMKLAESESQILSLQAKLSQLSYPTMIRTWSARVATFGDYGARIGQLSFLKLLLDDSSFIVSDPTGNSKPEVPLFVSNRYESVDLHEYFAAIRLALTALDAYYAGNKNSEAAAQVITDYARSTEVDLSRVTVAHDLMSSKMQAVLEKAFSESADAAINVSLHSGNIEAVVATIFLREPGTRWPILEQLHKDYGLNLTIDLLAAMVERSAETTADILMEYQRSTVLNDHDESVDSGILEMFLGLGEVYPNEDYQQQIIAAADSLALFGDFLLDVGAWTGENGDNNTEAVADALEDVNPLHAGLLLGEMYELEQERDTPSKSFVEDVIPLWLDETGPDGTAEVYATTIYIMSTGQISLDPGIATNSTMASNITKVNEYLEDPIDFLLDESGGSGRNLQSGVDSGGLLPGGNNYLYRTIGKHVMSKGLDYWVPYINKKLQLARDLPIKEIALSAGAISLGINDTDFLAETFRRLSKNGGEGMDALSQMVLGLLPNVDLFPDENWVWLRGWFKYTAPHTLGEVIDEAYTLNDAPAFESRATKNIEDLDAITAVFLENMKPEDAANLLAAMDSERANRILALMEDEDKVDAILEAMINSDDAAIRDAFTAMIDADDPDRRARLFLELMRNSPRGAWLRMYVNNGGSDFNDYMTIILNTPHDNPDQIAEAFARMLSNSSVTAEQRATILRNLILQGEGAFVGQVLGYMPHRLVSRDFLDGVFQNLNISEQAVRNSITLVLRGLLSQTILRDNEINYRARRILIYLSTIPVPGGDGNNVWLTAVFSSILNSDLRTYFVSHMIDLIVNNRRIPNISSRANQRYGNARTIQTRDIAERVLNELGISPYAPTAFGRSWGIMSAEETINNDNFQDTIFAIRVLLTELMYLQNNQPNVGFNPALTMNQIFNIIRLLAQRTAQGSPEEQLAAQRYLGRLLMPMALPGMRMPLRGQGDGLIIVTEPDQARLGIIFNHFIAENRIDIVIHIMNSMIASVDNNSHAYFMMERALSSMIRAGQPNNVGRILAALTTSLVTDNTADLVIQLLDRLRETQSDETFASILADMVSELDQSQNQALDQLSESNLNTIYTFVRMYFTADLVISNRRSFAVIFTHLANGNMPAFSQWILAMLDTNNPANSNGSLTRNLAEIFNSMVTYSGNLGQTNAGLNTLIDFISTVLAPGSGFTEAQRNRLGSLLNAMFRSQTNDEVQTLFSALAASAGGAGHVEFITNAMLSGIDGADNVSAILSSLPEIPQDTVTAEINLAGMDSNNAATVLQGMDPSDAAQSLAQMIVDGNLAAVVQIAESIVDTDTLASIVDHMHISVAAPLLSAISPGPAAAVIAYIAALDEASAARIILRMDIQAAVIVLTRLRDQSPQAYHSLIDQMAFINFDGTATIIGQFEDQNRRLGSGRSNNILSYVANSDRDGDTNWEARDDNGNLIPNTDHHFEHDQGVRRLKTSHLNHAYYFDGTGGSGMKSLQALEDDPTTRSASFEMWVRPDKIEGRYNTSSYLILEMGGKMEWVSISLTRFSLSFEMNRMQGFEKTRILYDKILPSDTFSHVVGVIELGSQTRPHTRKLHLYVNGEHVGSTSIPEIDDSIGMGGIVDLLKDKFPAWSFNPNRWSDGTDTTLGKQTPSTSSSDTDRTRYSKRYKGWIREFHFYDRVLSENEILDHYRLSLATPTDIEIEKTVVGGRSRKEGYKLSWPEVAEADGYNIYRTEEEVPLPKHHDLIGSSNGTTYTDLDIGNGKTYYYWITSHRSWEESDFSEWVSSPGPVSIEPKTGTGRGRGRFSTTNSNGNGGGTDTNTPPANPNPTPGGGTVSNVLILSDYDGNGLEGTEESGRFSKKYDLVKDENDDTVMRLVVKANVSDLSQAKEFDLTHDISDYDQLSFDHHSTVNDTKRTVEIQLRFANEQNPSVENYWNWQSPAQLSAGHGEWARASIDLSKKNFKPSSDWQFGNDFNLDKLQGIAVLIRSSDTNVPENTVHIDNIQVSANEDQ